MAVGHDETGADATNRDGFIFGEWGEVVDFELFLAWWHGRVSPWLGWRDSYNGLVGECEWGG